MPRRPVDDRSRRSAMDHTRRRIRQRLAPHRRLGGGPDRLGRRDGSAVAGGAPAGVEAGVKHRERTGRPAGRMVCGRLFSVHSPSSPGRQRTQGAAELAAPSGTGRKVGVPVFRPSQFRQARASAEDPAATRTDRQALSCEATRHRAGARRHAPTARRVSGNFSARPQRTSPARGGAWRFAHQVRERAPYEGVMCGLWHCGAMAF